MNRFVLFIGFIIAIRLAELVVARTNEKWARERGAVEYGKEHYPFIVALHVSFIVSLIVEYYFSRPVFFDQYYLVIFLCLIALKVWVISSLGKYWNTKILRIAHVKLVKRGPYRFVKHPNYIIVVAEIAIIPLVFSLYYTAVIFSILNAFMLAVRIRVENKALALEE